MQQADLAQPPVRVGAPLRDEAPLPPMFYVVAPRKFTILFVSTLGLYAVYWFYKNWDRYKDRVPAASRFGTTVSPVVRALFSGFFIHTLFNRIRAHGRAHLVCRNWRCTRHAWWLAFLLLSGECLDSIINALVGAPYGDLAGVGVLVLTLTSFLKAQRMINLACDDPAGAGNAQLSRANKVWIGLGVVAWIVTAIQAVMPLMAQ